MKRDIAEDEIKIKFTFNYQENITIICNINERIINILTIFCQITKIKLESVYFLCNGIQIKNFNITLKNLANHDNILIKEMQILVYYKANSVKIIISHLNADSYEEKKDIDVDISSVFYEFLSKNKLDNDNVILKYNNILVDTNQTIHQFMTKHNIKLSTQGLNQNNNDNNLTQIKFDALDIHPFSKINFKYQKKESEYYFSLEKNMGDIFTDYVTKNGLDKKKVDFKYKDISIKENQTLNEFIKKYVNNNQKEEQNQTIDNLNNNQLKENETKIEIDVVDLSCPAFFFRRYKLPFFIILGLIIVVGAAILIALLLKKKSDNSSSVSSPKIQNIPNDYFIKATYSSKESETIRLISNEYDLKKIKTIFIDGELLNPKKSHTFNEGGQHIIYYSFNYLSDHSLNSEGKGLFNGITNLIKIEVSNFSENYPDISFQGMFNNCINLQTADFSQMRLNYDFYYKFYQSNVFDYYNSMDYMFNNCTSLTSVNFDFPKIKEYEIDIISSKYMFNNCTSLTNLYISKINFYNYFNNMFSNCILLETLVLNIFNYYDYNNNMSYMFYNCTSLASLVFTSDKIYLPSDMSYSFAYCSSLKKLELEFDYFYSYYYEKSAFTMSNAFRNCTSLRTINFNSELIYEDMSYLFMGCTSLEDIKTLYNYFNLPVAKYTQGMFLDCKSLYSPPSIYNGFYSDDLIDISYMFSGSSLYRIDLSGLVTNYITNYEGLFYGCENVNYIDISSFTHNNLSDSNLSIFKVNYFDSVTLVEMKNS